MKLVDQMSDVKRYDYPEISLVHYSDQATLSVVWQNDELIDYYMVTW